jgi:hypothetical protein
VFTPRARDYNPLSQSLHAHILWSLLGPIPPGQDEHGYAFNAVGYWHAGDSTTDQLVRTMVRLEAPTESHPEPQAFNNYLGDAFVDAAGLTHILYLLAGETTNGRQELWQAIVENDQVTYDARLAIEDGRGGDHDPRQRG